jgi:hypothetical protein
MELEASGPAFHGHCKNRGMTIEDLVTRLLAATRAAFTQARELYPNESFYCYALYTDAFAAYILPTCGSEEGLQQAARRYADEFEGAVAEQADDLRWSPPDWPHHMLGEEHFTGILELLESRGDPWQRDDDGFDAEVDARFEACFRALALLDAEVRGLPAVMTGSINAHRSSDKSLGYRLRSLTPPCQHTWPRQPGITLQIHPITQRHSRHHLAYRPLMVAG